ncbi:MAG: chemotaxis protein CheA [Pseudomonadota bacterium]
MSEQDSLEEMSSEFIAEIKDDLVSLEPDLLAMEEKGANVDDELINHAFRSIHSIKGGAGFINFTALSSLSHAMENVLMRVREKELVITSEIVDALLSGFDRMKLMVELMGTDESCDYKKQAAALQKILIPQTGEKIQKISKKSVKQSKIKPADIKSTGQKDDSEKIKKIIVKNKSKSSLKTKASSQKPLKKVYTKNLSDERLLACQDTALLLKPLSDSQLFKDREFEVDKKRFERARESQKFVYAIHIRFEEDLDAQQKKINLIVEDIKSIGEILYSDLDTGSIEPLDGGFFCVITTILDLPLLAQVLEITKTQMSLVERKIVGYQAVEQPLSLPANAPKPEKTISPEVFNEIETREEIIPQIVGQQSITSTNQTIRVNVDLISKLMNRARELVLSRNQLRPVIERLAGEHRQAISMMQNLDMVTTDIQETIMQMRMQPIIDLMGKYKRVVRDIARRMSKKVEFTLDGAQVELDRNILEKLANPLTHLIRNCIDHGIESPDQRRALGKPETGTIHAKAFHQGGNVHIIISDDGAGIDPQLILSKAFEKGLVSEDMMGSMTDKQKIDLIFLPGFSTSEEITDISGRGVGMDVVKTNIERLRGQIEINSVKGQGSSVSLIIPLTLAIVPSLIIGSGDTRFAIPQVNIKEVIHLESGEIHDRVENIAGSEVLRLRDELFPVLRLRNVLSMKTYIHQPDTGKQQEEKRKAIADRRNETNEPERSEKRSTQEDRRQNQWDATYVIILKLGVNLFGLCVDELYDIEEVVVAPLSDYIKHLKCFAGTTILGDGSVTMILDVPGIAAFSLLSFDVIQTELLKKNLVKLKQEKNTAQTRNLIIFGNDRKEYFALPLDSISRLEPISSSDIHHTGDQKFFEYNNQAVLLYSMDEFLSASVSDLGDELFLIFPKHIKANVGIIASVIVDTIVTNEQLSRDFTCPDIVLGKLFVEDRMVQVLEPVAFFDQVEKRATSEQGKDKIRL